MEDRSKKLRLLFGKKIKECRMSRNLTQLDLAIKVGSDTRQIQRIENGENSTSIVMAYNLAKALDITMNELFDF